MATLLIVDDDKTQHIIIKKILKSSNYTFLDAYDGCEALETTKDKLTDIVITDILMPNMDGIELILHLKKTSAAKGIIAISSGGSVVKSYAFLQYVLEFGADYALKKPIEKQSLLTAVRNLEQRRRLPSTVA